MIHKFKLTFSILWYACIEFILYRRIRMENTMILTKYISYCLSALRLSVKVIVWISIWRWKQIKCKEAQLPPAPQLPCSPLLCDCILCWLHSIWWFQTERNLKHFVFRVCKQILIFKWMIGITLFCGMEPNIIIVQMVHRFKLAGGHWSWSLKSPCLVLTHPTADSNCAHIKIMIQTRLSRSIRGS